MTLEKRIARLESEAGRHPARLIVRRIVGRFEDRPECYRIHGRLLGSPTALELHRKAGETEQAFMQRAARELRRFERDPGGYVSPFAENPLLPSDSEPATGEHRAALEHETPEPGTILPTPVENEPVAAPQAQEPADPKPWRRNPAGSEVERTSTAMVREIDRMIARLSGRS
ncbi:hypothetical protein [Methylocaldum sp. 14B]|uniref:hypothetical protein n=1 Tax=Methylocaldum sp. 14B TaxID=1912213 RepID=UPI00098B637B|nr:hypothetical protein [Methylocaldum sp. 14B]